VAREWLGAVNTTLDLSIKVMDFLTHALHQWALHYALFGAICTAFSFDAWQEAGSYAAAEPDTNMCLWLRVAGCRAG